MGKQLEKKRKKKGRPSLLEIQKRNLKQQQEEELLRKQQLLQKQSRGSAQNPSPNVRRSTRRNPNPDLDSHAIDDDARAGLENEDCSESTGKRRRGKKLKLVSNLPDSSMNSGEENSDPDSGPEDDDTATESRKKRVIEAIGDGSGLKEEKPGGLAKASTINQETKLDNGPSTPLPDKKLLLFILDRLQKKDTYGVFADPVDPEELPDYHEVVEHPIDFSTIRKKLVNGAYANLEQFEKDVFLLCTNAMQYNSPDTIYFRQARSIQELAKKNFQDLRQDEDGNKPEIKIVRRGRPPTKNIKKPVCKPSVDRVISDSPKATLATGGGNPTPPNFEIRNAFSIDKYTSPNSSGRVSYGPRHGEFYINWSTDRADEIAAPMSSGIAFKHGKKQIVLDENRRSTYKLSCALARDTSSALTLFHGGQRQIVPVGLHAQYGYARSLARFAARLGSVAWTIASKKIQRCLPADVEFGPGWVGENDAISLLQSHQTSVSTAPPGMPECNGGKSSENQEDTDAPNTCTVGATKPEPPVHQAAHQQSGVNGSVSVHQSGESSLSESPNMEKPVDSSHNPSTESKPTKSGSPSAPEPDPNASFQSPRSTPVRAESVQPDLALQLW